MALIALLSLADRLRDGLYPCVLHQKPPYAVADSLFILGSGTVPSGDQPGTHQQPKAAGPWEMMPARSAHLASSGKKDSGCKKSRGHDHRHCPVPGSPMKRHSLEGPGHERLSA